MNLWAFVIPGLAMLSSEIPRSPGIRTLENPEIGSGIGFQHDYSVEDIARHHLETIRAEADYNRPLVLYGYSMGSMILSILATEYRSQLPKDTRFVFMAPAMNTRENPVVPDALQAKWFSTDPTDRRQFEEILRPFFSKDYLARHPDEFSAYVQYRMTGKNKQTPRAFIRQLAALRKFDGSKYFARGDPSEAILVYGTHDEIMTGTHIREIQKAVPGIAHVELPVGHMIFMEAERTALNRILSREGVAAAAGRCGMELKGDAR